MSHHLSITMCPSWFPSILLQNGEQGALIGPHGVISTWQGMNFPAYSAGISSETETDLKIFISQQKVPEVELQDTHVITSLCVMSLCHLPSCEPHILFQDSAQNKNPVQSHWNIVEKGFPAADWRACAHCGQSCLWCKGLRKTWLKWRGGSPVIW